MNKLTREQVNIVEDVIYTLRHGTTAGWENPRASLDACIGVLQKVRKSFGKLAPIEEGTK